MHITFFSDEIEKKIEMYAPGYRRNYLNIYVLGFTSLLPNKSRLLTENRALFVEAVVSEMNVTSEIKIHSGIAFLAGLVWDSIHYIGRKVFSLDIFNGCDITATERAEIKKEVIDFLLKNCKEKYLFVAYCSILNRVLIDRLSPLTVEDFPSHWSSQSVKNAVEIMEKISTVVMICDKVKSFFAENKAVDIEKINTTYTANELRKMFPGKHNIIEVAFREGIKMFLGQNDPENIEKK